MTNRKMLRDRAEQAERGADIHAGRDACRGAERLQPVPSRLSVPGHRDAALVGLFEPPFAVGSLALHEPITTVFGTALRHYARHRIAK